MQLLKNRLRKIINSEWLRKSVNHLIFKKSLEADVNIFMMSIFGNVWTILTEPYFSTVIMLRSIMVIRNIRAEAMAPKLAFGHHGLSYGKACFSEIPSLIASFMWMKLFEIDFQWWNHSHQSVLVHSPCKPVTLFGINHINSRIWETFWKWFDLLKEKWRQNQNQNEHVFTERLTSFKAKHHLFSVGYVVIYWKKSLCSKMFITQTDKDRIFPMKSNYLAHHRFHSRLVPLWSVFK